MPRSTSRPWLIGMAIVWLLAVVISTTRITYGKQSHQGKKANQNIFDNANDKVTRGQQVFRFDTFGDEAFWGGTLKLHQAIAGARFGGVGPGVSPATALAVGLKVDA